MQKIVELDQSIVNKIAAGEVIERPASVVKELVENAIDAEATRIEIDVEEGGRKRIQVTDTGYGMVDADVGAAFKSHATSKLKTPEDLFHITTLGFRGEALPSIGAVSRARITTCYRGNEIGARISMDGGVTGPVESTGAPEGTCVDVQDLFFNTPVRRKFMKSPAAEIKAIADVVTRIALAHCHIAFLLRHNGRRVFSLEAGGGLAIRIGELFEPEVREALVPVDFHAEGLSISGYAVKPSVTRQNTTGQYVFLNSRFIRDRGITSAIRKAYEGFLMTGRYPMIFLFADMDPAAVDVNVHPTKVEVRFKEPGAVFGGVVRGVRAALESADLVGTVALDRSSVHREAAIKDAVGQFLSQAEPASHTDRRPLVTPSLALPRQFADAAPAPVDAPPLKFMQVHEQYIVVETPAGIRLIDQHALHEKIHYTRLMRSEGPLPVQRLLVPVTLELSAADWSGVEGVLEIFRAEGFEIEEFGARTLAVYAVPQLLAAADVAELVTEAIGVLGESKKANVASARHELYAMVACKAAIKAGMRLSPGEIEALLEQHEAGDLLDFCPHGRPAVLDLSIEQLDKQFGRI